MARIDWNAGQQSYFAPGIYLVEVVSASERVSKNGDPMFIAKLGAAHFGKEVVADDVLMLAGKGAGIGTAKLKALGFKGDEPSIEHFELVGRRAWAALDLDEYEGKDGVARKRLRVNIAAEGSQCGYWPESTRPDGAIEPSQDEQPF